MAGLLFFSKTTGFHFYAEMVLKAETDTIFYVTPLPTFSTQDNKLSQGILLARRVGYYAGSALNFVDSNYGQTYSQRVGYLMALESGKTCLTLEYPFEF